MNKCHCRKDRTGHELVPFPFYVRGKLVLSCPAKQGTPLIPYHPDRKVMRGGHKVVIHTVPKKWALQRST